MTPIPMPMLLLTPMEDISSIFSLGHSVEFLMDTVVCGLVLLTMATMAMLMLRRWECITTEHRKPRRVTMYLLFSREWPVETRKEIYHQFCKSRLFRIHFLINSQLLELTIMQTIELLQTHVIEHPPSLEFYTNTLTIELK